MKKKIIFCLIAMLGFLSQQAFALRFRVRVPSGSSESSNGVVTWIVYAVIAVVVAVTLYRYFFKIRGFLRQFKGDFLMDENSSLSKEQQQKMLLGAVYAVIDKGYLNTIKTGLEKEEREDRLEKDWNICTHDSAVDALNGLKIACTKDYSPNIGEAFKLKEQKAIEKYLRDTFVNPNDAKACAKQIERAFKHIGNLVKEGIVRDEVEFSRIGGVAFEATRLVAIARMCAESKYISEQEMWEYVDFADEQAHKSLTSWEDYGKSYVIGDCLWGADSYDLGQSSKIIRKLINDPKSPWKLFPFEK
ncbi:hypothetical protein HMPREF2983_08845 [Prevotella sp. HMSC077E09]|uniref:DUF1266 domain-containing protein n=1 Tax=Prevotella sp. HMSC077E09 TaxID=1739487 RepID=UPI0008A4D90C|nr:MULTISPECIES: DUF1266 domain-containing protein [unclassified Prevotella]OFO84024.1 hypothetical protein HMPREF3018_01930 [Prevotella sp. HMSC077E08]OFP55086.1 hypothetical protein HMPREF2983_08845 [Prevotella sp. HMSC077E09]